MFCRFAEGCLVRSQCIALKCLGTLEHQTAFVLSVLQSPVISMDVFHCVLTVYDAFGKMGSNIAGGNVNQPGLLQQCCSTVGPSFSGQYCQVFLKQVNTNQHHHN